MPTRFWAEKPTNIDERPDWLVWRPPSSANRVLYSNMIRIWNGLFTPATISAVLGLGLYAFAIFPPGAGPNLLLLWSAALVLLGLIAGFLYKTYRPVLGTDD